MDSHPPKLVRNHFEWDVFQQAFDAAMQVFHLSKTFPAEERYALTDQLRRSSRGVSANLAEAWRRRRYRGAFLMRLNDAEAEAAETQTWLAFAVHCAYIERETVSNIVRTYENIIGTLVNLERNPDPWLLSATPGPTTHHTKPHNPKTPKPQQPKS